MIAPNMLFSYGTTAYWGWASNSPPTTPFLPVSFSGGDGRGNVPASQNGVLTFSKLELVGINTDNLIISFLNVFTRLGAAIGFDPLGSLSSSTASSFVWEDRFGTAPFYSGGREGGYGVKFRYTISNGISERTGNLYLNISVSRPAFR